MKKLFLILVLVILTGCEFQSGVEIKVQKAEAPVPHSPIPLEIRERQPLMLDWYVTNHCPSFSTAEHENKPLITLVLAYLSKIHEDQKKILDKQDEILDLLHNRK